MISIEHAPGLNASPITPDELRALLVRVINEQTDASVDTITVVLSPHTLVRSLNVQYLDHDYNTDVLAFNLGEEDDAIEGEVYVDVETAQERHGEFDTSVRDEVTRYAVHGVLHLLGHTDKTDAGQAEMRRLEDHYVQSFEHSE